MAGEAVQRLVDVLRGRQALERLVGGAAVFRQAIAKLPDIARGDQPVLISGETGTGKELVARAVHYLSARADFPFVPLNCGALPETLLEDELFGHEQGAFTDARQKRLGLIAQARRGTLFLDEVDALSTKAQVALLRVIQERRFRPIGSSTEYAAEARIMAATNMPLLSLVQRGAFRSDLYYRLCVFSVQIPPLRERKEDIGLLAEHFLKKHSRDHDTAPGLSSDARFTLNAYHWPGNVRELENAIIRGIYLCEANRIETIDLGLPQQALPALHSAVADTLDSSSFKDRKRQVIENFERDYLIDLIRSHGGNVSQAARAAGKDRRELGKMLKKYGLDPKHLSLSTLA